MRRERRTNRRCYPTVLAVPGLIKRLLRELSPKRSTYSKVFGEIDLLEIKPMSFLVFKKSSG